MIEFSNQIKTTIIFSHDLLSMLDNDASYVLITDEKVYALYKPLISSIPHLKLTYIAKDGEEAKSITTYMAAIAALQEANISKDTILLALGGGTITDLGGYLAGTYKRGLTYYNIPTTVIGMVDASIGGKTGLNFNHMKNFIGSFYHPTKVIVDLMFLNTLPLIEKQNGLGEIIKYGLIKDASIIETLLNEDYLTNLPSLIKKALLIKCQLVNLDPYDQNLRHLLNFGHTIGHYLEATSDYKIKHGIAVCYGMLVEASNSEVETLIITLLKRYGLYQETLLDEAKKMPIAFVKKDKKNTDEYFYDIAFNKIGDAYLVKRGYNEYIWTKY